MKIGMKAIESCRIISFFAYLLLFCTSMLVLSISAEAQLREDDPMVRITSRPLDIDKKEVMVNLSNDITRETGIPKDMVTYYWQTFDAVYCPGCEDESGGELIFVDLYVPGFMTDEEIAGIMTNLAESLEKHTGIDKKGVFIQAHFPKEGHVYISGKIAKWDEIKPKEKK